MYLLATRGACNRNLQVFIRHASHVCSRHSFGLPLRMNGVHRTQFYHARFNLLPFVISSRVFWPFVTWNLREAQRRSKSVLTFDLCRPHSVSFGYYCLLVLVLLSGEVGFFRGAAWVTTGLISLVPVYIPLSFVCSGRISMKESLVNSLQRGKKPMILNSKLLGWQLIWRGME